MIDESTAEWKDALRLVRAAYDALDRGDALAEQARAAAFDRLRTSASKRILSLAHLLQPGATLRSMQAALVPLERVDRRTRVTDADMGIRSTDTPRHPVPAPVTVVADNIRSVFNAGGLFRTADFFGIERLVLCGYTPTPGNPQLAKTALGADSTVQWEHAADVRDAVDRLRAGGYAIYALETASSACDVMSFTPRFPCAILLGNERFGLDPDVVRMADAILEIPSHGTKNSMNVVSAFAVAAAAIRKAFDDAAKRPVSPA
ncbi:MAG: TrmH family RNA methyltransferase [Kiritimatiellae bacterium]|nr:TrmH family RNA methyltransferase [Kiritimatiellia bacterium]